METTSALVLPLTLPAGVSAGVLSIDPGSAAALLSRESVNRAVSPGIVAKYAATFTPETVIWQPILLDSEGRVLDGQHRLHAVLRSKQTIRCFVITGVPRDAWDSLDQGKSRLFGDVLSAARVKNASTVAAAVALTDKYLRQNFHNASVARSSLLQLYEQRRAAFDAAAEWASHRRGLAQVLGAVSPVAFLHVMLGAAEVQRLARFWSVLETGAGGRSVTDPAVALRNRLLGAQRAVRFTQEAKVAMAVKAVNAEHRGEGITVLRYSEGDALPRLFCHFGEAG